MEFFLSYDFFKAAQRTTPNGVSTRICYLQPVKKSPEKVPGIYYLHGIKETSSGFRLNPDGTFQFFFTYGALDRYGSGTWKLDSDTVVLQSLPWPGHDFTLAASGNVDDDLVTVKILGNPQLVRHVFVSLDDGETGTWVKTNAHGEAGFRKRSVSSISIVFEFCPERYTKVIIENPNLNYFELRFDQWLMEVFFKNFVLKIEKYALSGKHPLMRGEKYEYERG